MAHIFISYSKEDADRARKLADLLRRKGWSVWWDPHIPIGETWADFIDGLQNAGTHLGTGVSSWDRVYLTRAG